MSWTWLIEVCGWEKILLEGPQCILHLSRSHGDCWDAMDLAILSRVFDFVSSLS